MPVSERTIKNLFAKSQNRCAMPDCEVAMVRGDTVVGEICHIRARRKNGPRYDPKMTEAQKNSVANLILLCPTCHTIIDKDRRDAFSVEWLEVTKATHERNGAIEVTPAMATQALALLAKDRLRTSVKVCGNGSTHAKNGGVAISIGGANHGDIKIKTGTGNGIRGYQKNSIGADANLSCYIEYICELYVKYMGPTGEDAGSLWARLGKAIKAKFRLAKRSRNDLPAERFEELVEFLVQKLAGTPIGRRHVSRGKKLCSTFSEWRQTTR